MKKLLIIGAGGYITAIVIPTIKKYFKDIEITLLSKRPANTITTAAKNEVKAIKSLDDIKNYDLYFLAIPPVDYEYFLNIIPKDKPLWIEKPLSEANLEHLEKVNKLIEKFKSNIYVGFNKREVLSEIDIKNKISGKLSMFIEYNENMDKNLWKQYMLKGGVYFADGIHMMDLALYILGENANIQMIENNKDLWKFEVHSNKGNIIVEIGNNAKDLIQINSYKNDRFISYKNSLNFFKLSFEKFLKGNSNYKISHLNSKKIIESMKDNL